MMASVAHIVGLVVGELSTKYDLKRVCSDGDSRSLYLDRVLGDFKKTVRPTYEPFGNDA